MDRVDGPSASSSRNQDLDVSRLPPHLIIGAGTAVAFFIFVACRMIEQLIAPDLDALSLEFLHVARNFFAISAGMTIVRLIMLRKEAELSNWRRSSIQKRREIDECLASLPSKKYLEVTLDEVFPAAALK